MASDPNRPEILLAVSTEVEASAIVTALAEYDIEAITVGGYTSGFKAEAPGLVAIVVRLADFDRAKNALAEIHEQQGDIDWSKVDVAENAETPEGAEKPANKIPKWGVATSHLCWTLELLGIAICLVIWLFTRQLTPLLASALAGLALIGILLALVPVAMHRR
jgi:hypothetical protein